MSTRIAFCLILCFIAGTFQDTHFLDSPNTRNTAYEGGAYHRENVLPGDSIDLKCTLSTTEDVDNVHVTWELQNPLPYPYNSNAIITWSPLDMSDNRANVSQVATEQLDRPKAECGRGYELPCDYDVVNAVYSLYNHVEINMAINPVKSTDSGIYRCSASLISEPDVILASSNTEHIKSYEFANVKVISDNGTEWDEDQTTWAGVNVDDLISQTINMHCTAKTDYDNTCLSITWFKNTTAIHTSRMDDNGWTDFHGAESLDDITTGNITLPTNSNGVFRMTVTNDSAAGYYYCVCERYSSSIFSEPVILWRTPVIGRRLTTPEVGATSYHCQPLNWGFPRAELSWRFITPIDEPDYEWMMDEDVVFIGVNGRMGGYSTFWNYDIGDWDSDNLDRYSLSEDGQTVEIKDTHHCLTNYEQGTLTCDLYNGFTGAKANFDVPTDGHYED